MIDEDPLRGTGRTSALMLRAISDALLKPDEWVTFEDHFPHTDDIVEFHADVLARLCGDLGLTIDVNRKGRVVMLRSPIARIRDVATAVGTLERHGYTVIPPPKDA